MITSIILTFVVFFLLYIAQTYIIGNAPFDPKIKWGFTAIAALIAIVIIAGIWGLVGPEPYGWHHGC
jgi:heme A synthase